MTYSTPRLVHVGSAQALVLRDFSDQAGCVYDNGTEPLDSRLSELW
jgi:hypothetical protein